MVVDISIKGLPDALVEELRRRAAQHNRSLESEVVAILQASVSSDRDLAINGLLAKVQALGLRTPAESAAIVREDRDARRRR